MRDTLSRTFERPDLCETGGMASRVNPGLCVTCTHVEVIRSDRGSTFFRCGLSDVDARFPKYPALPVLKCIGWASSRERRKAEHAEKESQD
jgi:hypothetical protein